MPDFQIQQAITRLQTLADLFILRREQLARSIGLTPQQWRILEEISGDEFMPSLFARQQASSGAAVSKILRQLEAKGLVETDITAGCDARRKKFQLTRAGQTAMRQLQKSRARAIDEIWVGFDTQELRHFSEVSETLASRMEDYSQRQSVSKTAPETKHPAAPLHNSQPRKV